MGEHEFMANIPVRFQDIIVEKVPLLFAQCSAGRIEEDKLVVLAGVTYLHGKLEEGGMEDGSEQSPSVARHVMVAHDGVERKLDIPIIRVHVLELDIVIAGRVSLVINIVVGNSKVLIVPLLFCRIQRL